MNNVIKFRPQITRKSIREFAEHYVRYNGLCAGGEEQYRTADTRRLNIREMNLVDNLECAISDFLRGNGRKVS